MSTLTSTAKSERSLFLVFFWCSAAKIFFSPLGRVFFFWKSLRNEEEKIEKVAANHSQLPRPSTPPQPHRTDAVRVSCAGPHQRRVAPRLSPRHVVACVHHNAAPVGAAATRERSFARALRRRSRPSRTREAPMSPVAKEALTAPAGNHTAWKWRFAATGVPGAASGPPPPSTPPPPLRIRRPSGSCRALGCCAPAAAAAEWRRGCVPPQWRQQRRQSPLPPLPPPHPPAAAGSPFARRRHLAIRPLQPLTLGYSPPRPQRPWRRQQRRRRPPPRRPAPTLPFTGWGRRQGRRLGAAWPPPPTKLPVGATSDRGIPVHSQGGNARPCGGGVLAAVMVVGVAATAATAAAAVVEGSAHLSASFAACTRPACAAAMLIRHRTPDAAGPGAND